MHDRDAAHEIGAPIRRHARLLCIAGLSMSLGLAGVPAAYAASARTDSELARLANEVTKATSAYSRARAKSVDLQGQVDALAEEIIALEQDVLPAKRRAASDAAVAMYKQQNDGANLLSMLFGAGSLNDLIEMGKYLDTIQSRHVRALEDLNAAHDELQAKLSNLGAAKDAAVTQQRKADEALASARSAHAEIEQKAASENAAEAAKAAAQAQQQIEQAEQQAPAKPSAPAPAPQPEPAPTPQPQPQPSPQPNPQPAPQPDGSGGGGSTGSKPDQGGDGDTSTNKGGWLSGVASYYGIGDGFMGGTTASGEIVTETSMGIAMLNVPFGTRVEIRYGGRSVIAYVNDRGPYVHGRVIDMQPAVARALNFVNVGVGTVQYRFL